ncbi:MAG: FecR family protein [Candidatus Acidiferrum sp.]|jgi:hypothetical protein
MVTRHGFGNSPVKQVFGALFFGLLALIFTTPPAAADLRHARIIRLSLVQGDVRFTRDAQGDPLTNGKNIWEAAVLNLPIREGYVLATDQGRAEVEFENGAMAFLSENTVLEFYDLSLDNGARTTRLVLRQGAASFYVNPSGGDYFSVTGGDFTAEADGKCNFRLDNFDDGSSVNVIGGRVSVVRKDQTTELVKGQSLSMSAGDTKNVNIARLPDSDDFDRWVSGREDSVVTATTAGLQYASNNSSYSSGFGDLYTYGSWFPVSGYGYGWRPYGVGLGWCPFDSGGWFQDSAFGWGFVGNQPWGWLPYHYGGWLFQQGFGWLWVPGNFGAAGYSAWRPATVTWVHSAAGTLGIVPLHPSDVRGKTPINLAQGVFPVAHGAVSSQAVSGSSDSWKLDKSPARNALTSSLSASSRPSPVSRTTLSGGSGNRIVAIGPNSSITYDAREHRFVNSEALPAHASSSSEEATNEKAASSEAGKNSVLGATSTSAARKATTPAAQTSAARGNEAAPPRRTLTPPPSASERSAGGSESFGGERGGPASTGRASSSAGSSARGSSGSAGSSGGGRPH